MHFNDSTYTPTIHLKMVMYVLTNNKYYSAHCYDLVWYYVLTNKDG